MSPVNYSFERAASRASTREIHAQTRFEEQHKSGSIADDGDMNTGHHDAPSASSSRGKAAKDTMVTEKKGKRDPQSDPVLSNMSVTQPGPNHHAHSQVSKVQPARIRYASPSPSVAGKTLLKYRQSHSKVVPFFTDDRRSSVPTRGKSTLFSESSTAVS